MSETTKHLMQVRGAQLVIPRLSLQSFWIRTQWSFFKKVPLNYRNRKGKGNTYKVIILSAIHLIKINSFFPAHPRSPQHPVFCYGLFSQNVLPKHITERGSQIWYNLIHFLALWETEDNCLIWMMDLQSDGKDP